MASDFKVNNITPAVGNIKLGSNNVSKIYQGSTQVWPPIQSYFASDLDALPYQGNMLNLQEAEGLWFSETVLNLDANPTYTSSTNSNITTPTTLNGFTQNDGCPSQSQYFAYNYGVHIQTSQTKGAFVIEFDMTTPSTAAGQGMAAGVIIQTRADDTQPWVDATNMSGIQMTNNTNHGYQINSSSQPLGLYRNNGICPTVSGGFGGCGSLCIESFLATSMNTRRYFAFDEVGEYRIILGQWLSTGGGCQTIQKNRDYVSFINIESLYSGPNQIGLPYHVSSSSNTSTSVNAYAAEYFPGAVQAFYSDQALTTPLTSISGARFFKRISTIGNIVNFELSKNGEYTAGFDSQGVRNTNITPNYN